MKRFGENTVEHKKALINPALALKLITASAASLKDFLLTNSKKCWFGPYVQFSMN